MKKLIVSIATIVFGTVLFILTARESPAKDGNGAVWTHDMLGWTVGIGGGNLEDNGTNNKVHHSKFITIMWGPTSEL